MRALHARTSLRLARAAMDNAEVTAPLDATAAMVTNGDLSGQVELPAPMSVSVDGENLTEPATTEAVPAGTDAAAEEARLRCCRCMPVLSLSVQ